MAGAVRCLLVRVERLEKQLVDASESGFRQLKEEQTSQPLLECISKCAVSIFDAVVSLDRSVVPSWCSSPEVLDQSEVSKKLLLDVCSVLEFCVPRPRDSVPSVNGYMSSCASSVGVLVR